jgi:hypothetical protein
MKEKVLVSISGFNTKQIAGTIKSLIESGVDKIIFDKGYTVELKIGDVIQVGKRKFIKLVK